jgi:hypothetical protein
VTRQLQENVGVCLVRGDNFSKEEARCTGYSNVIRYAADVNCLWLRECVYFDQRALRFVIAVFGGA